MVFTSRSSAFDGASRWSQKPKVFFWCRRRRTWLFHPLFGLRSLDQKPVEAQNLNSHSDPRPFSALLQQQMALSANIRIESLGALLKKAEPQAWTAECTGRGIFLPTNVGRSGATVTKPAAAATAA